jgi:hypothetical protein
MGGMMPPFLGEGGGMVRERRTRSVVRIGARFLLLALFICGATLMLAGTADGWQFTQNVQLVGGNQQIDGSSLAPCTSTNTNACLAYAYDWPQQHGQGNTCEPGMTPEFSAHAFTDASSPARVQMLLGTQDDYHRLMGPNLDSLVPEQLSGYPDARPCANFGNFVYPRYTLLTQTDPPTPMCDSPHDRCDPSKYHSREFLGPTWTADGQHVNVLIHNEYHGEDWECDPTPTHNPTCSTNGPNTCDTSQLNNIKHWCYVKSTTWAESNDGGADYGATNPQGQPTNNPPRHLVAAAPYQYTANQGRVGIGAPLAIFEANDVWLALVYANGYSDGTDDANYLQGTGMCVIRTSNIETPPANTVLGTTGWESIAASGAALSLTDPYVYKYTPESVEALHAFDPPSRHVCTRIFGWGNFVYMIPRSAVYDTSTNHWIVVGTGSTLGSSTLGSNDLYYSYSSSITGPWADPVPITDNPATPPSPTTSQCEDSMSGATYPSIMDPTPPAQDPQPPLTMVQAGRNFETIDENDPLDLFVIRKGPGNSDPSNPVCDRQDLARIKFTFSGPH